MRKTYVVTWYFLTVILFSGFLELPLYGVKTNTKPEQLYLKLQKTNSDTAKITALLNIYRYFSHLNTDSALVYAKQAYRLSKSGKYNIIKSATALGNAYHMANDYEKAIKYEIEALDLAQKKQDKKLSSVLFSNIASNYLFLNDFGKSYEYFHKALESSVDYDTHVVALLNLGQVFASTDRYKEAHDHYNKALKLAETVKNYKDQAVLYNRIGELCLMEENYPMSLLNLNKSLKMLGDSDLYYKIDGLKCITENYILTRRYEMGIKIAKQADSLARKNGFIYESKMINSFLSELYDSLRKPAIAFAYYKTYSAIKDSIFNIEKNNRMNFLQTEFETKQKEMQVENLQKEASFHRKMNYVYLIVSISIFIALFYFIKNIRQKNKILHFEKEILVQQKEKEKLEKQNLKLKLDEKHREILTHAFQIQQQKEVLTSVQSEIDNIIGLKQPDKIMHSVQQLNSEIKAKLDLSDDWDQIKLHFEKVHPDFFSRIKNDFPDLTIYDLKLCAYSMLKFTNKEVSRLLNINNSSVQVARYRLKKKMGLAEEVSFDDFISNL